MVVVVAAEVVVVVGTAAVSCEGMREMIDDLCLMGSLLLVKPDTEL